MKGAELFPRQKGWKAGAGQAAAAAFLALWVLGAALPVHAGPALLPDLRLSTEASAARPAPPAPPSALSASSGDAKVSQPVAAPEPEPRSRLTTGIPYREAPALAGKARVLLLHSLAGNTHPSLLNLAALYPGDIALLDVHDISVSNPTLAELSSYDVVIVATEYPLFDGTGLGDRLADYVDLGGKVIVTLSSWIPGWSLGGRFVSGGYLPFAVADTRHWDTLTLGSFDAAHPLMSGVTSLGGTFQSWPDLYPSPYIVARWDNGQPLAVVKGPVVGFNFIPRATFVDGNVALLFHNAVTFLMTPRIRVLVAPSDVYPSQLVEELVKDPLIGAVDYYDARISTPSLAQLSRYDAVITWPNYPYADRVAMGDVLAGYADIGGKVILGGFCWYTDGNSLGGAIVSGGYSPLNTTTGGDHYAWANLGAYDGSHPILWGVTAVSSPFRDYTSLAAGATAAALWDDGENFVAFKGNVVALNAGLMDGGFSGQVPLTARNAVKYLVLVYPEVQASAFTGSAPLTVAFAGSATGGQPPYTYRWDFGDGTSSAEQNPSHTFVSPGSYLVAFYPKDSAGHEGTMGFYVDVSAGLTLTASRTPASGTAPLAVSVTATPAGGTPPYTYDWNFGDGTAHGTTQNANHTFAFGGVFTTVLTVTDAQGHTASQTLTTTVSPALQAFAGGAPASGHAPLATTFFGFAAGGTPPYAYAWSFSDGGSASGASVTHTFASAGSYTATLTVTDAAARTAASSPVSVTVTVPPPVIASLTKKGNPFRIVVSGSNLQSGIQVYINGSLWSNVTYQSASQITLKGGSALKTAVPAGTPATFRFVNPDHGEATVTWSY